MIETSKKPSVHDPVLVEAEIDGKVVRFRAVVISVSPTALWLGLVKPNPLLAEIVAGDPIVLTFSRGGAGMVAESFFLSHLGTSQSRFMSVEMPADCKLVQRREYLRLDTECRVEYLVVSHGDRAAGLVGEGVTIDLSAGGLRFAVRSPIGETVSIGDALEIRLEIGQGSVLAEAEVVRVEDATDVGPDGRSLPPATRPRPPRTSVAVRFVSISEAAQDRIIRHIFAVQRKRRQARSRSVYERAGAHEALRWGNARR
jgi:hypothetical protein